MILNRLLRRFVFLHAVDPGSSGGGAVEPPAPAPAPAPAPEASPAPAAAPVSAPGVSSPAPAPDAPKTMLDAITRHFDQPRDEFGRFVPGATPAAAAPATPQATPTAPAAAPGAAPAAQAPAAPAAPQAKPEGEEDDPTKMPEGLTPKAQERFQRLANTVRERDEKVQQLDQQVSYVRESFQQHGVQREQFEQAVGVIGMVNRGEYAQAQQVLQEQLRHLAVLSGQPLQPIDPLQDFPDLRERVHTLQLGEQDALELARNRRTQALMQERTQQQQQVQQSQQRDEQAVRQATQAVDTVVKQLQASDIDFPAIEAKLLPVLPRLLKGVPPQQWANVVKTQYELLKDVASSVRPPAAAPAVGQGQVLRPSGSGAPSAAPKSMFEAMWGNRT